MATSEAVKKAVAKYQANQEHIKIHVPMGKKARGEMRGKNDTSRI